MRIPLLPLLLIACWPTFVTTSASACEYPPPPEFSKIASTSTRLFVFRVMNLKVREQSTPNNTGSPNYSVWVEADVLVQKTWRGDTASISTIRFYNGACGGVNLLIGHRYAMATVQTGDVIELAPADRSLADIDAEYDPSLGGSKGVEANKYVMAVNDAIDGKRAFDSVLDNDAYRSLSTVAPPPEIKIVTEPCKTPAKPVKKSTAAIKKAPKK